MRVHACSGGVLTQHKQHADDVNEDHVGSGCNSTGSHAVARSERRSLSLTLSANRANCHRHGGASTYPRTRWDPPPPTPTPSPPPGSQQPREGRARGRSAVRVRERAHVPERVPRFARRSGFLLGEEDPDAAPQPDPNSARFTPTFPGGRCHALRSSSTHTHRSTPVRNGTRVSRQLDPHQQQPRVSFSKLSASEH